MTRINTNIAALNGVRNLNLSATDLNISLNRLSSGLKINRSADNPAGLVISELLRAQIAGLGQAIENSERGVNMISTAEAALSEVNVLLVDMRSLSVGAANSGALSQDEIDANQLQVDSAVESINRIANTTSFGNLKLLNGNLDFQTSGVNTSLVQDLSILTGKIPRGQTTLSIAPSIPRTSYPASINFNIGAGTVFNFAAGATEGTFRITGNQGTEVVKIGNSGVPATDLSNFLAAVNSVRDVTGVGSNAANNLLFSLEYGENEFIEVENLDTTSVTTVANIRHSTEDGVGADTLVATSLTAASANIRVIGKDADALANGTALQSLGRRLLLNSAALDFDMTVARGNTSTGAGAIAGSNIKDSAAEFTYVFNNTTAGTRSTVPAADLTFNLNGGGAKFQVGSSSLSNDQIVLGIKRVSTENLGNGEVGFLRDIVTGGAFNLTDNPETAIAILDEAINDITSLRGRLGAFELDTLQTNIRSLGIAVENVQAAESVVRDTDFATETAKLTRAQILQSAGTSVLATANASQQNVLSLLQ